jgi:DMSO reductase anchor subunit
MQNHRTRYREKKRNHMLYNAQLDAHPELREILCREAPLEREILSRIIPIMAGGAAGVNTAQFFTHDPQAQAVLGIVFAFASEKAYQNLTAAQWTGMIRVVSYLVMTGNGFVHDNMPLTFGGLCFLAGAINTVANGVAKQPEKTTGLAVEEAIYRNALDRVITKTVQFKKYPIESLMAISIVGCAIIGGDGVADILKELQSHDGITLDAATLQSFAKMMLLPVGVTFAYPLVHEPNSNQPKELDQLININTSKLLEMVHRLSPAVAGTLQDTSMKLQTQRQHIMNAADKKPLMVAMVGGSFGSILFGLLGQYASCIAGLGANYITINQVNPQTTGRG